ncbi:IS3509a transposase [Bifidobacterium anseris]|uniref:IS3509a transposase n=1 Tax=Bifidobacterium anseris TaxID=2020963 RepID=A0A2N5IVZ5_9BIFI|nr:IS3509a transposase [Bifidobacterium anseris]
MRREDRTRLMQFHAFLDWVSGRLTAAQAGERLGVSARTFHRATAWCWNVRPGIRPDGVVHRFVQADGTFTQHGWGMLIAIDERGRVIAWQWCGHENRHAYRRLFSRIAPPDLLVCDGNAACGSAAATAWPGTPIQRCMVHVIRDTKRDLTGRPRTPAGRELLALARRLGRIHDRRAATRWQTDLNDWHATHGDFIKQRTMASSDPTNPKALAGRRWWWKHERLRRAYFRLARLLARGELFAALTIDESLPTTTNMLEGGVNADIKRVLDAHRGLNEEHMRRCCEWVAYLKSDRPDPDRFVTPDAWKPTRRMTTTPGPKEGSLTDVQRPAPGVDAYESGFGIRTGWAGRT